MFVRIIVAVLAIGFGLETVMAQQDPVKTREDLMKKNNDHAIAVVKMMRRQQPFDAAAVDAAFKQWADTAQVLPSLFPENSKTGGDNRAVSAHCAKAASTAAASNGACPRIICTTAFA